MTARPILARLSIIVALLLGIAVLALLFAPIDRLRPQIEASLTRQLGAPVRLRHVSRSSGLTLNPDVVMDGVSLDQAPWAGPGRWLEIDHVRFSLPLLSALLGRFRPTSVRIEGLRLSLLRTADGRENWSAGTSGSGHALVPTGLRIQDGHLIYRDAKQGRFLAARLQTNAKGELDLAGNGYLSGHPVTVAAHGDTIRDPGIAWPFSARIEGPGIRFRAQGSMATALNSRTMTIAVFAKADDLKTVDTIIEAGLFQTQAVELTARARHSDNRWSVTDLRGVIGRSRVTGQISVTNMDGRHHIDGDFEADPLDFTDLSSTEQIIEQAALRRAGKQRLIPDTKVDLTKLARTDGVIRLHAKRMVGAGTPPMRTLQAELRLDHSRLVVSPLLVGLDQGYVSGSLSSDQRGRSIPRVRANLALHGADLSDFVEARPVSGALSGRLTLDGEGLTLAQAAAHADGQIRFRARDGQIPTRLAAMLGLDAGRALTRSKRGLSGLRCGVLDLSVKSGLARIDRFLVDTTLSQARGTGMVRLADETVHMSMTGAPKKASLIQLTGSIPIEGTLSLPHPELPRHDRTVGAVIGSIGRAIAGTQPVSRDLDCNSLE